MNAPFESSARVAGSTSPAEFIVPSLERRRLQCYLALVVSDIVSVLVGFGVAGAIYLGAGGGHATLVHAQLLLPIFLTIALYNNSYSTGALTDAAFGIARSESALFVALAALVFFAFYTKSSAEFSRVAVTLGAIGAGTLLLLSRLAMRRFITWRCGPNVTNQLILDDGGPDLRMPGALKISASDYALSADLHDPDALARLGLILRNVDRVVVTCTADRRGAWAMMLKGANVSGEVLDDSVVELGAHGARVVDSHGFLLVSSGPLGLRARAQKRLLDLTLAGIALIVLGPLMVCVALAIRLEDGGPALFVQQRMGRGNRFFAMFKFRSMRDAAADQSGSVSTARDDRRTTRIGRLIRRTSIDELPQLFNVLRGDMSPMSMSLPKRRARRTCLIRCTALRALPAILRWRGRAT